MAILKKAVKELLGHVKIDKEWVNNFNDFYRGLTAKNESHVKFFGSSYLGVYEIKFEVGDFNYMWDILLECDRDDIADAINQIPVVREDRKVISEPDNYAFILIIHLVLTSKLSGKEKQNIIIKTLILFQFKFLTSRHYNDWEYLANKDIAAATYDNLSNQFKLKQYANWGEYLKGRSLEMYLGGDRRKDFTYIMERFDDDKALTEIVSGVSSNVGKVINRWNTEYYKMKASGGRLSLTSALGKDADGNDALKDLDGATKYRLYAESNIGKNSSFINPELVDVIQKISRIRKSMLMDILKYISDEYKENSTTGKFALGSITYGLNRLVSERRDIRDVGSTYKFLTNAYGNRRANSPRLEAIRMHGEKILEATGYKGAKSNTVTVISTYITIWAYLKK